MIFSHRSSPPSNKRALRTGANLCSNTDGVAVTEFAMLAPVLALTMMGLFDMSYNIYAASMVKGAIQKSARDSTIEGSVENEAELDNKIKLAIRKVVPSADVQFSRKAFENYQSVGKPEDFTDVNGDGTCADGEPFEDRNGNGHWDQDQGSEGFGGARDAVEYKVTVTYNRAFPLANLIGIDEQVSIETRTVLRNQPYGLQSTLPPEVENCI